MKRSSFMMALVICVVSGLSAQEISVSGTVTGNGEPVSGARVSLKNYPQHVAFTNSSGEFSITGSLPVIKKVSGPNFQSPFLKGSYLYFRVEENPEKVVIDIYSLQGHRIDSKKMTDITAGEHRVHLFNKSNSMCLVHIKLGQKAFVMKVVNGFGSAVNGKASLMKTESAGLSKASHLSDANDTLIVNAENWKNALVELAGYNNKKVEVELFPSNPWRPSGLLIKEGSMVRIMAAGYDFEMGQAVPVVTDQEMIYGEQPVHTVNFTKDFWMDTTEVTQKLYDSLMTVWYPEYVPPMSRDSVYGSGDNMPAYFMNWDDAALFCNARSKQEGLDTVYTFSEINGLPGELSFLIDPAWDICKNGYRLPTEAEWEYACRGGTVSDFYWGQNYSPYPSSFEDSTAIGRYAVWSANSFNLGAGVSGYGVHDVGTTLPNAYGLYDMVGNVSEHVNDIESFIYEFGKVTDPIGPETGDIHLIRGGNWGNDAMNLRSSSRNFSAANYPFYFCGFRTVKTAN